MFLIRFVAGRSIVVLFSHHSVESTPVLILIFGWVDVSVHVGKKGAVQVQAEGSHCATARTAVSFSGGPTESVVLKMRSTYPLSAEAQDPQLDSPAGLRAGDPLCHCGTLAVDSVALDKASYTHEKWMVRGTKCLPQAPAWVRSGRRTNHVRRARPSPPSESRG